MKLTDLFLAQLEAESKRTRRALERVPDGRDDWKPHDKSMPLGRLAALVASMPSWFSLILDQDELDLNPPGGSRSQQPALCTSAEFVKALEDATVAARDSLTRASEAQLMEPWRLLVAGRVVSEDARYVVVRDTFMHLSHHRAQLTVYLRLLGVPVPAIYGPSADDPSFP